MKFSLLGVFAALSLNIIKAEVILNVIDNCFEYGDDGNCKTCEFRYVLKDGECAQVSDFCNTWDESTGDCVTCYDGFKLEVGACILGA
jgi:hypothetical protein